MKPVPAPPGIQALDKSLDAPALSRFPAWPASWYFLCHRSELRNRRFGKRILDRDVVAFETDSKQIAVLDARCSHLGANLSCGEVIGETIQCPFHSWRFGVDGQCRGIPGSLEIPAFAMQQSYPVAERHGCIFFFNGSERLFPLPFFDGEDPDDYAAARSFSYEADASWFMVAAQGFDRQHFESVHDRRLLTQPVVISPSPFVRKNHWEAEIIGQSFADRLLRAIAGKTVSLTIQNWGGTFYVVKAQFPRACSRFVVSFRPIENNRTHFDVIVYSKRGVASLGLPIRRWLTMVHLISEARKIRDTQYRPGRMIPSDADMVGCFRWLAAIPQHSPARALEGGAPSRDKN